MISVVTISMNQGEFLPTAVESVLAQRDVDFEYVIVDPGSTDGSREYLASIRDPRVRLVLSPDRGPADGLNKGVRYTSGVIVGYVNSDDILLAGALREVEDFLLQNPSVDVVYGDGWIIDGEGRVRWHCESTPWGLRQFAYRAVTVLQPSTFFRREAFDRTNGFNIVNTTCWDSELLVDLALTGARLSHSRSDWSAFRLHPGGISGSGRLRGSGSLKARFHEDWRRVVALAIGRDISPIDTAIELPARAFKLLRSPGYALRRVVSRRGPPRRIDRGVDGYFVVPDAPN